jgi:tetratricopeptide (TPR) repeat protein
MFVLPVSRRPIALLAFVCFASIAPSQQPGADQLFQTGIAALKESKFAEADSAFRKVTELEPTGTRGWQGVAQVLLAQTKPEDAIALLQGAVKSGQDRSGFHVLAGDAAVRAGKFDLALAEFRLALVNAGAELYVPRGAAGSTILAFNPDPLAESLNVLTGRDATPKGPAGLHLRLAEAYRLRNDHIGSAEEWSKLSALVPNAAWVTTNLGVEYDAAGKREEAAKAYRDALAISPGNAVVLNNLAFLLAETPGGDLFEAQRFARRARLMAPGSPDIMDTEGWISLKQGYVDDATGTFLRILTTQPENPAYRNHLAAAIVKRGLHSSAIDALLKALNAPPIAGDEVNIRTLLRNLADENQSRR